MKSFYNKRNIVAIVKKKTARHIQQNVPAIPPLVIIIAISLIVIICTAVLSPNPPAVLGVSTQAEEEVSVGTKVVSFFSQFYSLISQ